MLHCYWLGDENKIWHLESWPDVESMSTAFIWFHSVGSQPSSYKPSPAIGCHRFSLGRQLPTDGLTVYKKNCHSGMYFGGMYQRLATKKMDPGRHWFYWSLILISFHIRVPNSLLIYLLYMFFTHIESFAVIMKNRKREKVMSYCRKAWPMVQSKFKPIFKCTNSYS